MLKMVVSRVGFVGVMSLPVARLLYTGLPPSPFTLSTKPEAEVTMPLCSITATPS